MTTNGITGNTENQQTQASASRTADMDGKLKLAINVGIGIVFVSVGVILANSGTSFAVNILIALALFFTSSKLLEANIPSVQPWGTILRFSGLIVLATTLLFSGFGQWTIGTANWLEGQVAEAAAPTVPSSSEIILAAEDDALPSLDSTPMCTAHSKRWNGDSRRFDQYNVEVPCDQIAMGTENVLDTPNSPLPVGTVVTLRKGEAMGLYHDTWMAYMDSNNSLPTAMAFVHRGPIKITMPLDHMFIGDESVDAVVVPHGATLDDIEAARELARRQ